MLAVPRGIVARVCLLFGPDLGGNPGFFDNALAALARGEPRPFFRDEFRTPLDYRSAAEVLTRLIESEATGLVHVGGRERLSRFDLMRRVAIARGIDVNLIRPSRQADVPSRNPDPPTSRSIRPASRHSSPISSSRTSRPPWYRCRPEWV